MLAILSRGKMSSFYKAANDSDVSLECQFSLTTTPLMKIIWVLSRWWDMHAARQVEASCSKWLLGVTPTN